MPNWIEGCFRARGKREDINNFLVNGLNPVTFFGDDAQVKKEITEDGISYTFTDEDGKEKWYSGSVHIRETRRQFLELKYGDIYVNEKDNGEVQLAHDFKGAWGIDTDTLKTIAEKYNIDIKVNGYERGMGFTQIFEVDRNGNVLQDSERKFGDWTWDCDMPILGG